MGMDFLVGVKVKTTGAEKIDALEQKIEKLKSQNIDLKVRVTGADLLKGLKISTGDIARASSQIGQTAGKNLGNALDKQVNTKLDQTINNLQNKFKTLKTSYEKINNSFSSSNSSNLGAAGYQRLNSIVSQASESFNRLNLQIDNVSSSNIDSLNADMREFSSLVNKAQSEYSKLTSVASATKQQNALNSLLRWGANNSKAVQAGGIRYDSLVSSLRGNLNAGQLDDVIAEVKAFQTEMVQTGNVGKSFGQEIVRSFKQIGQFATTYGIIQNVIMEVPRRMISDAIKVDDAMTTLRMATSLSNNEARKLMDTYAELGDKLKATSVDVATSATEWLKQGKSIAEAEALSSDSIILSKIGDISSEEATKTITAAMKSYDLAEDEVMGFIDKISSIDLVSATDVGGLSQAFNEVAANAKNAGVETEKLLSYAAVIGETSQEGMAGVGTSLNAIFSRMGNIKLSRLKDYETGEDLSNVETVLRGVGIALRDSQDKFREFDDVLDDTAERWNSFSSVQQRAVAQAFSGTHHMNSFMILMQNWGKVQEYTTVANEASGQSLEKFSAYQESATGKIEGFKNAFQSLSMSAVNSDIFKGIIDSGTGLLNLLTDIISLGNGIPALFTAIGGVSFFKNLD